MNSTMLSDKIENFILDLMDKQNTDQLLLKRKEVFNRYTTLAAEQMYKNGKRFSLIKVAFTLPFEFFKRYILKLGILDGIRGLLWAAFSTFYVLVKNAKLWQLQEQKEK